MFVEGITFVIGAGASTEYGERVFPVGGELRARIQQGFDFQGRLQWGETTSGDKHLFQRLHLLYRKNPAELTARLEAARLINQHLYMFPSIDAFIDHYDDGQNHVAEMGKAAIAVNIARAERGCLLAPEKESFSSRFDLSRLRPSWIEPFARILMDNLRDPELVGEDVSIICFNYDRCIETYLIEAMRSRYRLTYEDARRIVGNMNIIHPYGTLGPLPETEGAPDSRHPEFGPDVDDRVDPWSLIKGLKTYTERVEEEVTIQKIHAAMTDCRRLVFLGFGFTTENMKLLTTSESVLYPNAKQQMLSTGKGISKQETSAVQRKIAALFANPNGTQWQGSVVIETGVGCADLLGAYYQLLQR